MPRFRGRNLLAVVRVSADRGPLAPAASRAVISTPHFKPMHPTKDQVRICAACAARDHESGYCLVWCQVTDSAYSCKSFGKEPDEEASEDSLFVHAQSE